ncbi:SDR family NAD(P)-dependent oxidoreductase [Xylanibacillus composti]|uniref:Short-chain dehydrogenase n=1 Tax=Xylanibacillus composti TaxID=1572762 RepID=A0A8J4M0Y1_9BACL|nr:SDR family oxidoreductase [Xylanibacillus composti]MDT9724205.1 SDR family NAD(P)-dependent oxidoreductase [Xylanibacillus composti]GIQ68280.1 short-chain dehydrogenase [Xylanibacillus composti]
MNLHFEGKTVVVTGAASGIGRGMAIGFAREGATVVASDIHLENLQALQSDMEKEGLHIEIQACDVSSQEQVAALFEARALQNGLDVLVHCAGLTYFKYFTQTEPEEYRRLIEVNLSGTFYCMKAAASKMQEHGKAGSIIVTSSVNAHRNLPSQAVYTSTKAAIESLAQSLAVEVAPQQIRVNCLAPGAVATALTNFTDEVKAAVGKGIPLGRVGEPEDMVGTALFLASPLSQYITGATIIVDGGLMHKR